METRRRNRGLVGPLILVVVGILFLLGNLGLINWDVWQIIFRFWPVLLIAFGLEVLIGRRSLIGSIVVVALVLALIGALLLVAPVSQSTGQGLTSQSISQPLQGAKRANVDISYGAGRLQLAALPDSDLLVDGTVSASAYQQVTSNFSIASDIASYQIGVRQGSPGPFPPAFIGRGSDQNGTWDLKINREIPTSLKVNGGVGTADLDLSQLKLTSLDANLGVGRTSITVPSTGQVQAKINCGVGETVVVIPSGVSARIQAEAGLGGLNVPSGYQKQNNVYTSPDYGSGSAPNRLDLTVHGGVGRVSIQQ